MKKVYLSLFFSFALLFTFSTQVLAGYIGPGLVFNDNNMNLPVRDNTKVLLSFRAPKSGNITKFHVYLRAGTSPGTGYSSGTGGRIQARIWPANTSTPARPIRTGNPLSTGWVQMNLVNGARLGPLSEVWPLFNLTANAPVVAGQLYFMELSNIDPNAQTNWLSVNNLTAVYENVTALRHMPVGDWVAIWEVGSTFYDASTVQYSSTVGPYYLFPSAEYGYADGEFFGYVRLEPGNYDNYIYALTLSTPVRERFNIKENLTITGMELHAAASVPGNLSITYKKNGSTVGSHTITQSVANYFTGAPNNNGRYVWYSPNLTQPFTVVLGDVLDVEMVPVGSSIWRMSADRTGVDANLGLSGIATYSDSSAQKFVSGNWQNTYYGNHNGAGYPFATSHFRVILKTSSTTPTPTPTPTPTFSKCDQNHDSSINVLDLQSLANVILGKTTCTPSTNSGSADYTCDLNQDSSVNVLDLQYLANVILGKNTCQ